MGNSATKSFADRTGFPHNLTFRNVADVWSTESTERTLIQYSLGQDGNSPSERVITKADLASMSDKEKTRSVLELAKSFQGTSTTQTLLPETDPAQGKIIYFNSGSMHEFVPKVMRFLPLNPDFNKIVPRPGKTGSDIEPDLIAGVPAIDPITNRYFFSIWFICSRQFYHAYILLRFDKHSSIMPFWFANKNAEHTPEMEERLRKKATALSNKLGTNPALWLRSTRLISVCEDGTEIPSQQTVWETLSPEEKKTRLWAIRGEGIARTWCHTYIALVAILRWGMSPNHENPELRLQLPRTLLSAPSKTKPLPKIQEAMCWSVPSRGIEEFYETIVNIIK